MNGKQHKIVGAGFGVAGTLITMGKLGDPYGALILPASLVGCMLPDIDHDMTKIGRKRKAVTALTTGVINILIPTGIFGAGILALLIAKGIVSYGIEPMNLLIVMGGLVLVTILRMLVTHSKTFKWATKHRGIMHTLVVPALMFVAMRASDFPLWKYTMMGLLIGYLAHLFADMLTIEGCPVLFPITKTNIKFMSLKTKDKSCDTAARIVFVLAVGVGIVLGLLPVL